MAISEKVMEALRAGILLNERVTTLIDKVKSDGSRYSPHE
jgi:hypothetical protein